MDLFLSNAGAAGAGGAGLSLVIWMVIIFGFMYFVMIRPQRKEEKKKREMMNTLAIGDTVLTTSGFYGVVIDVQDDTVIVEFGSNKNCRIPMQKAAISFIEKPEDAIEAETKETKDTKAPFEEDEKKEKKKGFFKKK